MVGKVIGVVASPRKGCNTDTLVQTVLDGAKDAGAKTTKYYLNDLSFAGCQACQYCKQTKQCKIEDDAKKVIKEITSAQAAVFGSPIYFHQLTGQLVLFQDRLYCLMAPELGKLQWAGGVKAMLVVSQGAPIQSMSEPAVNQFNESMKFLGFKTVDPIIHMNGNKVAAKDDSALLKKAKEAGKALAVA